MARASILLAGLALFLVVANVLAGALAGLLWLRLGVHTRFAFFTVVGALAAWTVVGFFFAGAFAWVRENVEERRLDAALLAESRRIRNGALPLVVLATLALIAAYVIGGGADTGAVPPGVHLALALLALFLHFVAAYRTVIFVGMALDLQERVEEGDR